MVKIYKSEEEFKNIIYPLPILGSEAYLQSKSDDYGWFISENFVLPFIIDEKLIFKRMIFTLETIYLQDGLTSDDEKKFLDEIVQLAQENKLCDFINKAQSYTVFHTYPTKSIYVPWKTYEIDITKDDEAIFSSFNQSHQRALLQAIKDGIQIRFDVSPEDTYELIYATAIRTGSLAYPPLEYFRHSKKTLGSHCLYAGAYKDGVLQTVSTIFFDDKRAYELYGGYIFGAHKGSGQFLKFEIIKYIKAHSKAPIFDLCGERTNVKPDSKYAAIQQFKERFSPIQKEGYAFKVIINPLKTKLFNTLVKLYSKRKGIRYVDPIDQLLTGDYD